MESERHICVGGRRLRVRRSGTGPPILLLNGIGMSPATWLPLERCFDGFECIGVSIPGSRDGIAAHPVLSMRKFAALTGDLLDELGIGHADVLGFSFGGMIAQQLAYDAPERVRSLILVSTSCGLGGTPSNPLSWWNAMLGDVSSSSVNGPQWLARQWFSVMRRELGVGWTNSLRLSPFAQQLAAASLWSSLRWLPRLTHEALVITGTADALVPPENGNILASRMPRAQLYRVRGGGHLCLLDRVAEVGPVIANFLSSLEPAAIDEAV
jgi:poly(3-hydroxyoctanoate) depolymerase